MPVKTIYFSIILIGITLDLQAQGTAINPLIMGQSYHYTKWTAPSNTPGVSFSPSEWTDVRNSGTKLVRVGGKQYNIGSERPIGGQEVYYVSIIDDIRKNGGEPVLTLPFLLTTSFVPQPNSGTPDFTLAVSNSTTLAQKILRLVNIVHKRNIKFVVISNEPDYDYNWEVGRPCNNCPVSGASGGTTYTGADVAANIAGYFKPMAEAVKEFDPSIKIIGPEYTHLLPEVYDHLLDATQNPTICPGCCISQVSPKTGQPYLDYVSVHAYGPNFNDVPAPPSTDIYANNNGMSDELYVPSFTTSTTWAQATSTLTYCNLERYSKEFWEPSSSARRYRGTLRYLRNWCADANVWRQTANASPLGFMITEMNSSHSNSVATSGLPGDLDDMDTKSLEGAQNLTRMYALAMEYGAASVMMWSVKEGANTVDDRGYLTGQNGYKRASYYHYKKLGEYFSKGLYYRDEAIANFSTGSSGSIANDGYPNAEPNAHWLHYKSGSTETVGGYALGTEAGYNDHLKLRFETKGFAVKGSDIAIMILNHSTATQSVVIKLNGSPNFTTSGSYKFLSFGVLTGTAGAQEILLNQACSSGTNAGGANAAVENNSTHLLILDCTTGQIKQRYKYRLSDEATDYFRDFFKFYDQSAPTTVSAGVAYSPTNCVGIHSPTLTVTGAGTSGFSWLRLPQGTLSSTSNTLLVTPTETMGPGIYQAFVPGCGTMSVVAVVHQNSPLVDAGDDQSFCNSVSTVTVGDASLPQNQTYTWSAHGGTNRSFPLASTSVSLSTNLTLTASVAGCTVADVMHVTADAPDIMIADDALDKGLEPNPNINSGSWYTGHGIWVRNQNNTLTPHQNPLSGMTNYVNVQVINQGCVAAPIGSVTVQLFHTKATTTPTWNSSYNNILCSSLQNSCTPPPTSTCGAPIGTLSNISALAANGGSTILTFTWSTPINQLCFSSGAGDGWWNLLAHVSTPNDQLPVLTSSLQGNVTKSNNVASKQVFVTAAGVLSSVDLAPDNCIYFPWVVAEQPLTGGPLIKVRSDYNGESLLDYADVYLLLSKPFVRKWDQGGNAGSGVTYVSDSIVQITSREAQMTNISFSSDQYFRMALYIEGRQTCNNSGGRNFEVDFLLGGETGTLGAVRFLVPKDSITPFSGEESLSSSQSHEYRVTGVKNTSESAGVTFYPSPAGSELTITSSDGTALSYIEISDLQGRIVFQHTIQTNNQVATLQLPDISQGTYLLIIRTSNENVWRKKFIKSE